MANKLVIFVALMALVTLISRKEIVFRNFQLFERTFWPPRCLNLEIWQFLWRWMDDRQTNCFPPCACTRVNNVQKLKMKLELTIKSIYNGSGTICGTPLYTHSTINADWTAHSRVLEGSVIIRALTSKPYPTREHFYSVMKVTCQIPYCYPNRDLSSSRDLNDRAGPP